MRRFLILFSSFFLLYGCKNDKLINQEDRSNEKKAYLPGMQAGTLAGAYVYYKDNYYWTPFAGGLKFNRFTYPTDKFSFQNYSRFTPDFDAPTSENNLLSFNLDDNRFTIVLGTAIGGLVYKMRTKQYLDTIAKGYMPAVNEYLVRATTGDADGLIVHTGQFVIDHAAPLGVSIIDLKTPLPGTEIAKKPTPVAGYLNKGGINYYLAIYEYSDKIFSIYGVNVPKDAPKSPAAFNATYSKISIDKVQIIGTMTLNDGTVYNLNDILDF